MAGSDDGRDFFPVMEDATEAEALLAEWANWWLKSDDAPAKMPEALHVRTAVYFVSRKYDRRNHPRG